MAAGRSEPSIYHPGLDDPRLTAQRGETLRHKKFLRRVYGDWYRLIKQQTGGMQGPQVELGSGAGFLEEEIEGLIKSDILPVPRIHLVLNSAAIPLAHESTGVLVMLDVLHHMPRVEAFFSEAARVLRCGGLVVMIEPWLTAWSRWVFARLHHERTDANAPHWHFESSGPLSGANQALPWIIFQRDRQTFQRKFPMLEIVAVRPMMPLRYLLSGGFSVNWGAPGWAYPLVSGLEWMMEKAGMQAAMFALIVLRKTK